MNDKRIWGACGLESALPHIIVDASGKQQAPKYIDHNTGKLATFKNRGVATRLLNQLRRERPAHLFGDPKTWRVEPVREEE